MIDLEEGGDGKKSESVIGGGEDTVSHFSVKKKAPIFVCIFPKKNIFYEIHGVQIQIWMFVRFAARSVRWC